MFDWLINAAAKELRRFRSSLVSADDLNSFSTSSLVVLLSFLIPSIASINLPIDSSSF